MPSDWGEPPSDWGELEAENESATGGRAFSRTCHHSVNPTDPVRVGMVREGPDLKGEWPVSEQQLAGESQTPVPS